MNNYFKSLGILCCILLLGSIFRLYKLGAIPNGLYQDETAISFNAHSIATTGKDEHNRYYPFYFESFGDQKLPVYIYSVAFSQQLFGVNEFAVRFPSTLFGIFTIAALFLFVLQLTKKIDISLLSAFILSINPWHIHYSRATFEVSIVLFLFIAGTTVLLRAFEKKTPGLLVLSTICFIIALYSYNVTRILSPVVFISLIILFRKQLKHIHLWELITAIILFIIGLMPVLMTILNAGGFQSASGTLITSSAQVQAPLIEFRSYVVHIPILNKLFNYYTLTFAQYIKNIIHYFSLDFFFISGSSHGNHGIATHGLFYLFDLLFITVGVFRLYNKHKQWLWPLAIIGSLTVLIAALTRESPHATRSYTLLMVLPVFSAIGLLSCIAWIKQKNRIIQWSALLLGIGICGFTIISFFTSYFVRFPIAYAKEWRAADRELLLWLKDNEYKYDQIIIDPDSGLIYTSILYYLQITPTSFLETVQRTPPDSEGFTEVTAFGKYRYRSINWQEDLLKPRTLYITLESSKPKEIPAVFTAYLPQRPVVIALKQELLQFPVSESVYVAVENLSEKLP